MVFLRWLIVICYVAVLLIFSSQPASSAHSMTKWLLEMFPNLSRAQISALVFYIRKGLHVAGYFFATGIIFQAINVTPRLKKYPYLATFIFTLLFAIVDEWQQSFFPFRTGSVKDVVLDSVGILLALGLLKINQQRKKRAPGN